MCGLCIERIIVELEYRLRNGEDVTKMHPVSKWYEEYLMTCSSVAQFLALKGCNLGDGLDRIAPVVWMACLQRDRLFNPDEYAKLDPRSLAVITRKLAQDCPEDGANEAITNPDTFFSHMETHLNRFACKKAIQSILHDIQQGSCPEASPDSFILPQAICYLHDMRNTKRRVKADDNLLLTLITTEPTEEQPFSGWYFWLQRIAMVTWGERYGLDGFLRLPLEEVRSELIHYLLMQLTLTGDGIPGVNLPQWFDACLDNLQPWRVGDALEEIKKLINAPQPS